MPRRKHNANEFACVIRKNDRDISDSIEGGLDSGTVSKLLNQSIAELNQNMRVSQENEKNIISRINQVRFPFGNIPIGLDELISIFPIIIAIGTTICVFTLRDTIALRRYLDKWYQKKSGDSSLSVSDNLSLIAPLWINPIAPKLDQIIKFSILLVPPLIFALISIYQISFGWGTEDIHKLLPFLGKEGNIQIFTALYTVFSISIAYSYWKFMTEVRHYRKELKSI